MAGWGGGGGSDPRVDDLVLGLLSERAGRIAFNGLRRALGVHPESLTRALRRLEREGVVTRSEGGYALSERVGPGRPDPPEPRTIASVELPPGSQRDDVLGRLAGRWFGNLRWVGLYEHPGDPWLVWSAVGAPGQLMLSVREGILRILTDAPSGAADGTLERAAFELLAHVAARIPVERAPARATAATFELGPSPVLLGPN